MHKTLENKITLKDFFETSPDGVVITNISGEILSVNQKTEIMFDYKKNELVGKPIEVLIPGFLDAYPTYRKKSITAPRTRPPGKDLALFGLRKNGSEFPVNTGMNMIDSEAGKLFFVVISDESSREELQATLRKREALLKEMGRIAQVGGWELDVATMKQEWTDETYVIHDREREAYDPNSTEEISRFEPGSKELIEKAFDEAIKQGKPYDLELEMTTVKGKRKWVRAVCSPLLENGKVTKLTGTVQDITKRKRAEERLQKLNEELEDRVKQRTDELQKSEERYRLLANNASDMISIMDLGGNFNYVSPAIEKLTGFTPEEFTQFNFAEVLKPESLDIAMVVLNEILAAISAKKPYFSSSNLELELLRKDGTTFWADVVPSVLYDTDGDAIGIMSVSRDITERKQAEEALRDSESRLKLAQQATFSGVWDYDRVNDILYWSNEYYLVYGISRNLPPSQENWLRYVHPEDREMVTREWVKVADREGHFDYDFRILRPDGEMRWVNSSGQILTNEEGRVVREIGITTDITERKGMENALRESETRYRSVVEDQTEYICRWKPDGTITFLNQRCAGMYGKRPEDLINTNLSRLVSMESLENLKRDIQKLSPEQPTITKESSTKNPNLLGRWYQWTDRGIFNEEGQLTEIQSVGREITERKTYEQEILLKNAVLDAVANTIVITDPDGNIIWVNPSFTQLTGYSQEEAIGKTPRILKSGYHNRAYYKALWDTIKAGRVWRGEFVNKRKDGSLYNEEMTITPVKNEDGRPIRFIAVKQDITARKKAEDTLKEQTIRLQHSRALNIALDKVATKVQTTLNPEQIYNILGSALSQLGIHFFVGLLDRDSQDLVVQHVAIDSKALSAAEKLVGAPTRGFRIPRQNFPPFEEIIEKGNAQFVRDFPSLLTIILPGLPDVAIKGISKFVRIAENVSILNMPLSFDNNVIGVLGLWGKDLKENDIPIFSVFSSQIANAIRISELFELTQAANKAKTEFLSRMSHELRTPMNSILGFAQLMEISRKDPLTDGQRDRLQKILTGGQHLLSLIDEVLDISRIESDRISISKEHVRIRDTMRGVCEMVTPLAEQRNIQIDIYNEPGEDVYIVADQQRLKQVLLNLLSNAIKYSKQGKDVIVDYKKQGNDYIRILVRDMGPGIATDKQKKLFIPFERLGAEGGEVEGTGLGLAVAKRLVELMKGRIGVESTEGKGSTFWVEFALTEDSVWPASHEDDSGVLPGPSEEKFKILYIENNLTKHELARQVLGEYPQVELLCETRVEDGIVLANHQRLNLILLDFDLPNIEKEALLRLKSDEATSAIPVVVLSAETMPGRIRKLTKLGAEACLAKPLNIKEFIQLIDELVHREDGQK